MSGASQNGGAYQQLLARTRDIGRLRGAEELLQWDQETCMPPGGLTPRAEQLALISGLAHEWLVVDEFGRLLEAARREGSTDGDPVRTTNLREIQRLHDREVRLPTALVKDIAHTSALARHAWVEARAHSDFARFAPLLARLIELRREVAERVGFTGEPYDALLDEFEPGATVAVIAPLFAELREATIALLRRLQAAPAKPDASILTRAFPVPVQQTLSRQLAELLGFDFERGRMDVSAHPFTTSIGGGRDVRFTTRYLEDFLPSSLFGTLHEVGHALYEQGLPPEHIHTPMGWSVSLGIHESQSRTWENFVGRSRPFWEGCYPRLRGLFPSVLHDISVGNFYNAINAVRPSFIRVEADELTYNLHIVLRFELERALILGKLNVQDVPEAWNEKMRDLLGVTPPNDAQGCLQDVHWSMGGFGYFPTYTLGNLYGAQFFAQAQRDIPDLDGRIRAGNCRPLLDWLRTNIHQHGQRYRAHEIVQRVTGKPLSLEPFLEYVTEKFAAVYGL
ncbi:MAG TPA: carboxypeptidase M32 [Phycisphaerae bacterium]|nr:carboxypeptidase M32 [Phycisphaerae bacterium]HNU46710.1 carboxypeptidase M32 [Phycisphaerae bacterium]